MKESAQQLVIRVAAAALVSAVFCAGAVFFVVDLSLRGMETAITTTNARFDDVNARFDDVNARFDEMNARLDARFEALQDQNRLILQEIRTLAAASFGARRDTASDVSFFCGEFAWINRSESSVNADFQELAAVHHTLLGTVADETDPARTQLIEDFIRLETRLAERQTYLQPASARISAYCERRR